MTWPEVAHEVWHTIDANCCWIILLVIAIAIIWADRRSGS